MKKTFLSIIIPLMILLLSGCNKDKEYQVFAVKFQTSEKILAQHAVIGAVPADSVDVCNMFWLIKGSDNKNILVDAGFIKAQYAKNSYVRPDSMLQTLKLTANDISDIIITHPHFDHIGGITLFPNAKIWMQKADYDYFIDPAREKNGDNSGFVKTDIENIKLIDAQGRLNLVKGDNIEIFTGIKAYIGSKHTFENQYLLVNSNSVKNKILLASDAIWFYINLEKHLPITFCMDTASYVAAIKRMETLVLNHNLIIPGHDDRLFSKFPKVGEWIIKIEE